MYKTLHYTIHELVHPYIIKKYGEVNSWLRLDEGVLRDIDLIRGLWFEKHGSGIYVNRLNLGLDSRGYRPPHDPDGAEISVHKQGKAFDLEPVNGDCRGLYDFVYDLIKSGVLQSINTLEDFRYTKTWVHVANMNTTKRPLIVRPR